MTFLKLHSILLLSININHEEETMKRYTMLILLALLSVNLVSCGTTTEGLYNSEFTAEQVEVVHDYITRLGSALKDSYTTDDSATNLLYLTDYMSDAKEFYNQAYKYKVAKDAERAQRELNDTSEVGGGAMEEAYIPDSEDEDADEQKEPDDNFGNEFESLIQGAIAEIPEYDNAVREDIEEAVSKFETKEALLEFYTNRVHMVNVIGFGDSEPTFEELEEIALREVGTEDNPSGISIDEWNAMSLLDAKSYCIDSILYDILCYNDSVLEKHEYFNSDEYKDFLYESIYHHDLQVSRINSNAGLLDSELEERITQENLIDSGRAEEIIKDTRSSLPEHLELSEEQVRSEVEAFSDKDLLLSYYISNIRSQAVDFDEGTDEQEKASYMLSHIGNLENPDGVGIDAWNSYTLSEAKDYVVSSLLYDASMYNRSVDELKNYYNSVEYEDAIKVSENEHIRQVSDYQNANRDLGGVYTGEYTHESSEAAYEAFISQVDMDNPAFSASIEQDEDGNYYIPWKILYDLADEYNNGIMMDNLEFIAYGQIINIPMPEVPLSYYAERGNLPEVVKWRILEDSIGRQQLEITIKLPEDKENRVFNLDINSVSGEIAVNDELEELVNR